MASEDVFELDVVETISRGVSVYSAD